MEATAQSMPPNAPVSGLPSAHVSLHYGPYSVMVADQHDIFAHAAQLIQTRTPHITLLKSLREGYERDLTTLPVAHLPRAIVEKLFDDDEDGEEANRGSVRRRPATHPPMNLHGRPAIEVTSSVFGTLVATNWSQWKAVRDVIQREALSTAEEVLAQGRRRQSFQRAVEAVIGLNAEVVILWFDVDTLHRLHYAELSGLKTPRGPKSVFAQQAEAVDGMTRQQTPPPLPPVPDIYGYGNLQSHHHTQSTIGNNYLDGPDANAATAPRSSITSSSPYAQRNSSVRGMDGDAPVVPTRTSHTGSTSSSTAFIRLVSPAGEYKGEVQLQIAQPAVSRQGLVELVKAAIGVRRHRNVRMCYRLLPPQALLPKRLSSTGLAATVEARQTPRPQYVSGRDSLSQMSEQTPRSTTSIGGCNPHSISVTSHYSQQPAVLAQAPLRPLETEEEVEGLVRDILHFGYRAIRIVVVESTFHMPTAIATTGTSSAPITPTRNEDRMAALACYGAAAAAATGRPPLPTFSFSVQGNDSERDVSKGQRGVNINAPVASAYNRQRGDEKAYEGAPHPTAAGAGPRVLEVIRQYKQTDGKAERPDDAGERSPVVSPKHDPPKTTIYGGGATGEKQHSTIVEGTSTGSQGEDSQEKDIVVVRYEVNPTELYITGPVSATVLLHLASSIYHRCCIADAPAENADSNNNNNNKDDVDERHQQQGEEGGGAAAAGGCWPHFVPVPRTCSNSSEGTVNNATCSSVGGDSRSALDAQPTYMLKLHDYFFDEEQEEELERCVAEAMQTLEGFELVPCEEIDEVVCEVAEASAV